jgi:hypothetical protein
VSAVIEGARCEGAWVGVAVGKELWAERSSGEGGLGSGAASGGDSSGQWGKGPPIGAEAWLVGGEKAPADGGGRFSGS